MNRVPNVLPSIELPVRIALIGEAPGPEEDQFGVPFVGMSGQLLNGLLSKLNILRDTCFIGNVCQTRPEGNKIALFDWHGDEFTQGHLQLKADLAKFRPNIIVCLGGVALNKFINPGQSPGVRYSKGEPVFKLTHSIDAWRGSLFLAHPDSPCPGAKCIATYHPAACFRTYWWRSMVLFDLSKALSEASCPELVLPPRNLLYEPKAPREILDLISEIEIQELPIAIDIEGGVACMTCCSIATSPGNSFIVPFHHPDGSPYWKNPEEDLSIWRAFADLMANPQVPKILQNGLYDRFVLHYAYRIPVLGCQDDTMLMWWERFCELEKGLAVQASVLTKEPYYKFERKTEDASILYKYCCKDSAVTYEIAEKLRSFFLATNITREQENLRRASWSHYQTNHECLDPLIFIELFGVRYDSVLAKERAVECSSSFYKLQYELDVLAHRGLDYSKSNAELMEIVREKLCYKRDQDIPKKSSAKDYYRIKEILSSHQAITNEQRGFINSALGLSMNIKSRKKSEDPDLVSPSVDYYDAEEADFRDFLYKELQLPVQKKRNEGTITCDYDALLKLSKWVSRQMKADPRNELLYHRANRVLELALDISELRTRMQMLEIHSDPDGRIRCGYNITGTKTGRLTCYTSPTGSGYNLHTLPDENHMKPEGHVLRKGMHDLCLADEGYFVAKCDLKGSDGWTIGAYLNMLGDPTMIEDLRAGIKPANRLCYMLRYGNASLQGKPRSEIKSLLKEIKKDDWDYFACKVAIWGICYLMGPDLLSDQILKLSEGKIFLSRDEVKLFHDAVQACYKPRIWWHWMERKLKDKPELGSCCGFTRRFRGRPQEILGEALSHLPQVHTTWATNKALLNLWNDPENWCAAKPHLRIIPLHHWHDALVLQWREEETDWALPKIRQYFDNPLEIAGQKITIPFDGSYGKNWGILDRGTI
jgi:uracil-DNA glycosylase family 4